MFTINNNNFIKVNQMSKFTRCLSKFFKMFDLFPATQYLRYNQQPQYKTATGGCVSIAFIIIFFILFYSLGLQTLNKKIINGSVSYSIQVEPSQLEVTFKPSPQFMFMIAMPGFNLNNKTEKYFNFTLAQNTYGSNLQNLTSTPVPFVQCTPQHFSNNKDVLDIYKKFDLSIGLCPPFNYSFTFKGRVISPQYSTVSIYVERCNKTIDSTCLDDSEIAKLQKKVGGSFIIGVMIVNTIVNPADEDYMQTYLEDHNYYYFNTKTGVEITAQIQEMEINTDHSLLPTTDIVTEKVIAIPDSFRVRQKQSFNNRYIEVVFNKASTSTIYTRSFNKVDDYFSYVGGLVGTIILFFFILSNYSEKSYVINIASEIYSYSDDNDSPNLSNSQTNFNFFYYFCMVVRNICKFISCKFTWKEPDRFTSIMEQMEKQLNIAYLLKRVNFFQSALTSILNQHQFQTLLLNQKQSIKQAKLKRRKIEKILNIQRNIQSKGSQNKLNESSINNMVDLNLQQNGQIKQPLQVNLRQNDQSNHQSGTSRTHKQASPRDTKQNLAQVINQSKQGNPISRRIMKKLNRKIFPELNQPANNQITIQQKNGSFNQLQAQEQQNGEKEIKAFEHFDFQLS